MANEIALIVGGKIFQREGIDLEGITVYEDIKMEDATNLAKELEDKGEVKVIITTAGTASQIENHVKASIIRTKNTYFDILQTMRNLEEMTDIKDEKIALILHSSTTLFSKWIQPYIKNKLTVFYYNDVENIKRIIENHGKEGINWFVGGSTTLNYAREMGFRAHLLSMGVETLQYAVDTARSLIEFGEKEREQMQRLQTIVNLFPQGIFATDANGVIDVCNPKAMEILGLSEGELLGNKIDEVTHDSSWIDVYKKGKKQVDVLRDFSGTRIFTTYQPIINKDIIIGAVGTFQEAEKIQQLEQTYRRLQTLGLTAKYKFSNIVGESFLMKTTIKKAKAYARVNSTILIEGETGTGKELFSQSIHNYSSRKNGPFVALNCAALPENLLESEIMGYEEGAFTGAKKGGKAGLFELAHNGTIFLDEVNQIPLRLQARVLRVIQEKQVMRLGGERIIPVDVRIIAATNENLEELVSKKRFREDLYYRLNVMNLKLPALRDRTEDIPLLVEHYFNIFSGIYGYTKPFTNTSINLLMNYAWPGNVRELGNLIERYIVINKQQFIPELSFVKEYTFNNTNDSVQPYKEETDCLSIRINTLEKMEEQIIEQVLKKVKGNKVQAAMLLGLSRTTLWKRLKSKNEMPDKKG